MLSTADAARLRAGGWLWALVPLLLLVGVVALFSSSGASLLDLVGRAPPPADEFDIRRVVFKPGEIRIRVTNPPADASDAPFKLVGRTPEPLGPGEIWVVNGWQDDMRQYFERSGATVREVSDMDLEEVFVEMLRSSRAVLT